jgi:hypothetical protein
MLLFDEKMPMMPFDEVDAPRGGPLPTTVLLPKELMLSEEGLCQ